MSFYNTGNPVPSIDPRDLDDNAKHIDELVNSTFATFTDRLGTQRKTLAGIEADNALITSPGGSALVGHNDGLVGSADVNLQQVALESLCVTRFGAIGNYVVGGSGHDSTSDFQDAFNAASVTGRRALRVPAGTYLITAPVTGEPLMLIGEVGATRIVFKNMAAMKCFQFTFASSVGKVLGSHGIEYIVEGANVDCVFEGPKNSNQYFTYFLRYYFSLNYFHGANRVPAKYSFGWDYGASKWLRIGDCVGAQVDHNNFQGAFDIITDPAGQLQDCAIELDANGAILSARIHDNNIGPIYKGISVKDRVFMTVHDNDFIGNMDGIVWEGTTQLNEPKIYNNNFNSQRYGIYVSGPDSLHFTGNTIRRHSSGWKGATHDWNGYYIEACSDLKLVGNTVQPDESGGAFTGTMTAYNLKTCGLGSIADNFVGVGNDNGFILDDCTGLTVTGTISAQSAALDTLFDLRNSTRRSSIGVFALVSTFIGTKLKKDGTITDANSMINSDFDLQSTGNVVLDLTRVSAALDEKRLRLVKGTTTFAVQFVSDAGASQNALIFTQTGNTPVSADIRGTEVLTAIVRPRSNGTSSSGTASFQWSDVLSVKGTFSGPLRPGQYTLATLPSAAAFSGYEIDVTDATGGSKRCRSNGSVWQILNTTTTVS